MKKIFILLFLLPLLSKAQVYQAMPQAGYGPVKRMIFDSVLSIPLGITKVQNITGGRDTGQLRYNKADSSLYTYSGSAFRKVSGTGGSTDTTSLSNRIDNKLSSITATSPITVTAGTTPIISTSMATNKLIGRSTASTGVMEQIAIGSGLTLLGGTLTNTATPTPIGYYGAFHDNTIQTAAAINTPYAMKFGINDLSNSVSIVSDGSNLTKITIANTGIYNIQFSAQFDRTNSGTDVVDIWLRKNGVDVAGTGGKIVLSGSAIASAVIATWNYVLDVTAGDYYQLMWSTPDTHVRLLYEPAQTSPFPHPLIPSTILTITQQSGIMAGTGITAINSLTGAAQTLATGTTGTNFAIASTGTTHTFNLPDASTIARGVITTGAQTMAGQKYFVTNIEESYSLIAENTNGTSGAGIVGIGNGGAGVQALSANGTALIAQSSGSGKHAEIGGVAGITVTNSGRTLIGTSTDNTLDALQVNGNIKADNTRYILKSAGAANSTTTLATCGLNTPTLTAGTYRFSILISYNAATTGTGARFVIDGTGTAPTALSFSNIRTLGAASQSPVFGSAYLVPSAATATSLTTGNICKIEGIITLPSTAVLSVKFASSTTSAITVLAGSYFEYF